MHLKSNVFKGIFLKNNIDCLNKIIDDNIVNTLLGCGNQSYTIQIPIKIKT